MEGGGGSAGEKEFSLQELRHETIRQMKSTPDNKKQQQRGFIYELETGAELLADVCFFLRIAQQLNSVKTQNVKYPLLKRLMINNFNYYWPISHTKKNGISGICIIMCI